MNKIEGPGEPLYGDKKQVYKPMNLVVESAKNGRRQELTYSYNNNLQTYKNVIAPKTDYPLKAQVKKDTRVEKNNILMPKEFMKKKNNFVAYSVVSGL